MPEINQLLAEWLEAAEGRIGQVLVRRLDPGYELRHVSDAEAEEETLDARKGPEEALEIVKFTDDGRYRPLKGAFDLRTGWRLQVANLEEVRRALDFFYPAALGLCAARRAGRLRVESLMDTLKRQTGMYRFAQTLSEKGARNVIENRCVSTCLRHRLWDVHSILAPSEVAEVESGVLPFLCPEACSLLIGDARLAAKGEAEGERQDKS